MGDGRNGKKQLMTACLEGTGGNFGCSVLVGFILKYGLMVELSFSAVYLELVWKINQPFQEPQYISLLETCFCDTILSSTKSNTFGLYHCSDTGQQFFRTTV